MITKSLLALSIVASTFIGATAPASALISVAIITAVNNQSPVSVVEGTERKIKGVGGTQEHLKGNNGHGNDADGFDSSNPGNKAGRDTTDDDGVPGGS